MKHHYNSGASNYRIDLMDEAVVVAWAVRVVLVVKVALAVTAEGMAVAAALADTYTYVGVVGDKGVVDEVGEADVVDAGNDGGTSEEQPPLDN